MKETLAIVIPYYKISFFEETLQSLANQANKNFNVYIGDDASPDNPQGLLKKYEGQFNFSYRRFENNLGSVSLVKQWQRCIALTGNEEWIMVVGDDDVLSPDVTEMFYRHMSQFSGVSNLVRFASQTISSSGEKLSDVFHQPQNENAANAFYRRFKKQTASTLSEYIFRKDVFKENGFRDYPLAWHSDDMAWLEFAEDKPVFAINDTIVYIRYSDINISGKKDNLAAKAKASEIFYKELIEEKGNLFTRRQIAEMLYRYETGIRGHRKMNKGDWAYLFKKYFYCMQPMPILKFIKRRITE